MEELSEFCSTEKHINAIQLHIYKCSKMKCADKYSPIIKVWLDKLVSIHEMVITSTKNSRIAYNNMLDNSKQLKNIILQIFNLSNKLEKIECNYLILKILTNSNLNEVGTLTPEDLLALAEKLQYDLKMFGKDHSFYPLSCSLEVNSTAVKTALDVFTVARQTENEAKMSEDIVKAILRVKYHCNFVTAEIELGKQQAEMIFPTSYELKNMEKTNQNFDKKMVKVSNRL